MNEAGKRSRKLGVLLICLTITIVILVAGLWPFNFRPRNQVEWLTGQNGIHFGRLGIAYTRENVFDLRGAIRPGMPVSIELVVRPGREPQYSLPRILTLYAGGNRQYFTLAQRRSHLILRADPRGGSLQFGSPEMSAKNVLEKDIPRFLTVTAQDGNTAIYVNGQMVRNTGGFPILPSESSASGKLVIGNSPTGHSPWNGDILFLAVYDRELPSEVVSRHFQDWAANGSAVRLTEENPTLLYNFAEREGNVVKNAIRNHADIMIPKFFHVLQETILRLPWHEEYFGRFFFRDVTINILGFIPFGFFFGVWLRKGDGLPTRFHAFSISLLGCGISLVVEILQIYLPTRTSSFTDLICNVSGTLFGVYLLRWILLLLSLEKRPMRNQTA